MQNAVPTRGTIAAQCVEYTGITDKNPNQLLWWLHYFAVVYNDRLYQTINTFDIFFISEVHFSKMLNAEKNHEGERGRLSQKIFLYLMLYKNVLEFFLIKISGTILVFF